MQGVRSCTLIDVKSSPWPLWTASCRLHSSPAASLSILRCHWAARARSLSSSTASPLQQVAAGGRGWADEQLASSSTKGTLAQDVFTFYFIIILLFYSGPHDAADDMTHAGVQTLMYKQHPVCCLVCRSSSEKGGTLCKNVN